MKQDETTTAAEAAEQEEKEKKEKKQLEDLIQLFTTPVEEMSDEELSAALTRMSEMRKTRIATKKKQDYIVDVFLPKLSTKQAEQILKKLEKAEKTGKKE